MANKPDKFGFKFLLVTNIKSKYVFNDYPYLGKDEERPADFQLGKSLVLKLLEPHKNRELNVSNDSIFFYFCNFVDEFFAKKTAIIGIMRLNKREFPRIVRDTFSPR